MGIWIAMGEDSDSWTHIPIATIEDLSDAVLGAGLEPTQLTSAPFTGSLLFGESGGIVFSSGYLDGRVGLQGALSEDKVALGLGVEIAPGSRHWLTQEVQTGSVGVWCPGDEHDALYTEGSLYVAVTLAMDLLEEIAADMGLVLDARTLPGTGFDPELLNPAVVCRIRKMIAPLHTQGPRRGMPVDAVQTEVVDALVMHLARQPRPAFGVPDPKGYAATVKRARDFIADNLSHAISAKEIAEAAGVSRSTLFRAFLDVLGEPPNSYVRKLRLHRIRNDLASEQERAVTVTIAANDWGISELGRLSAWYREHFGELPSETLARARAPHNPEQVTDDPNLRRSA